MCLQMKIQSQALQRSMNKTERLAHVMGLSFLLVTYKQGRKACISFDHWEIRV